MKTAGFPAVFLNCLKIYRVFNKNLHINVLLLLALLRISTKITSRFGTTRYKKLVESDKYLLNLYPYKLRL